MKKAGVLLVTLLIAVASVGAEWGECAGWSSSALARHACCAKIASKVAPDTSRSCCAMSEQSRGRGPTQARVAPESLQSLRTATQATFQPAAETLLPYVTVLQTPRHVLAVPLYVRHHSLLI